MKAYWFESENSKLGYDDNRKPIKGRTHKVKCEPVLCQAGLHASISPFDALQYAKSETLWEVDIGGKILKGDDKIVGTERKYIRKLDTTDICDKFARMCALDVIYLWDAHDVVIKFLKTGDESLREEAYQLSEEARARAMARARESASASASASTMASARALASASARASARASASVSASASASAWASASASACASASASARAKQKRRFDRMVKRLLRN